MLSSSEIESYHQDGFVIPDFRIDEQTLEQIRSDHERLLKKHPEFLNYCPNVLAYDLSFLNYARIPEILDLVESVHIGLSGRWPRARSGLRSMQPTLKMDACR